MCRLSWNLGASTSRPLQGFLNVYIVKVKCTLVQALRLCTGRTAHTESGRIALVFLDRGTRRGWGVSVTPRPLFTPWRRPGTHCTGGWVGPRARLDRCGKSRPVQTYNRHRNVVEATNCPYVFWLSVRPEGVPVDREATVRARLSTQGLGTCAYLTTLCKLSSLNNADWRDVQKR